MDRFPSMLVSLILHLTAFAVILFWPAQVQDKPKLGGLVVQGYVTLGKEGAPAEVKTLEEDSSDKGAAENVSNHVVDPLEQSPQVSEHTDLSTESPVQPEVSPETPKDPTLKAIENTSSQNTPSAPLKPDSQDIAPKEEPQDMLPPHEQPTPKEVPSEQKEKELPKEVAPKESTHEEMLKKETPAEPVEVKEKEILPLDKTEKKPEKEFFSKQKETTEDLKKEAPKTPEKDLTKDIKNTEPASSAKNATAQATPKPSQEPKKLAKVEEKLKKEKLPSTQTPKKAEKKSDPIKEALQDIAKKTPKQQPTSESSSSLFDALDDIKKETRGNSQGSGTGGDGGTGIGAVTKAYAEVVGNTIKKNWAMASRADREELHATVRIFLSKSGTIEKYTMITPSGDKLFDSSLINAIASTPSIPEVPPTPKEQVIDINFYP